MTKKYTRLTLNQRLIIEEGLNHEQSIRSIAKNINCSPSSVLREIKANRLPIEDKKKLVSCFCKNECKEKKVCGEECINPVGIYCKLCTYRDCRSVCSAYIEHGRCNILEKSPYVCNRCIQKHYFCNRQNRYRYDARSAHALSCQKRRDARSGIDMDEKRAIRALSQIKEGLARGLSPYELSVLYEDKIGVHRSTIYRWVNCGYGGLSNLELERKVGFRPRKKKAPRKVTSHSSRRAYSEFEKLAEALRRLTTEMDTVIGRIEDVQAILTLYHRPSDLQLALLLHEKTCDEVKEKLLMLKKVATQKLFERFFLFVLTDNGREFEDEDGLAAIFDEGVSRACEVKLFYCDVRQSQQKGSCEKNHSELRQILEKGLFVFDDLDEQDLRVLMSHANSNPRECLFGKSPIEMFVAFFGQDGQDFLSALGIEQIDRDHLNLTPDILDIERAKRGIPPVKRDNKNK
uniref:Transposase IS30-like HTH domain-containing protein n=1 Tax=uncultured prokaryote TaxID=198431 RepID=A0A0H5Q1X6_9ZZZZ|nr:hypothetical protein [uncultured prokaryote]